MKTNGKNSKKNVGKQLPIKRLRDHAVAFERTGTKIPKSIKSPSQIKTIARRAFRRLLHFMLVHINITSLDRAIKSKTGKVHNRGAVSRARAKGFNQGYQKAVKDHESQWI